MTNVEVFKSIKQILYPISDRLNNFEKRMENFETRMINLDKRLDLIVKLVSIFAISKVRAQIKKDNLHSNFSDKDRVITAIARITDNQNDLNKTIIDYLGKHSL